MFEAHLGGFLTGLMAYSFPAKETLSCASTRSSYPLPPLTPLASGLPPEVGELSLCAPRRPYPLSFYEVPIWILQLHSERPGFTFCFLPSPRLAFGSTPSWKDSLPTRSE